MKKLFAIFLAALLALSLVACGNEKSDGSDTSKDSNISETEYGSRRKLCKKPSGIADYGMEQLWRR